jgi:hypothetical protein
MRLITVDSVVRSTIMSKRYTIHHYGMFLHYALDFLREMNFDLLGQIRTCSIEMSDCNFIEIPSDYIDYTKIGIERNSKIQTIGMNPSISRLSSHNHTNHDHRQDQAMYVNGDSFGALTSSVSNMHPNSYKIITESNRIQFDLDMTNTKVYLEYLAFSGELHGLSILHPYAQKAMEEYILWKHKEHSRSASNYERDRARREYFNARRTLLLRKDELNLQTILRLIRENSNRTIKN